MILVAIALIIEQALHRLRIRRIEWRSLASPFACLRKSESRPSELALAVQALLELRPDRFVDGWAPGVTGPP
jgi:hypothetical protein